MQLPKGNFGYMNGSTLKIEHISKQESHLWVSQSTRFMRSLHHKFSGGISPRETSLGIESGANQCQLVDSHQLSVKVGRLSSNVLLQFE